MSWIKEKLKRWWKWLVGVCIGTAAAAPLILNFGAVPLTDFKFWYIRQSDDGCIEEIGVRYYEGAVTTQNDMVLGKPEAVTRYRRTKRLGPLDLPPTKNFKQETNGTHVVVYTARDFGTICVPLGRGNESVELGNFLKDELAKDTQRTPITEQK